MGKDELIFKLIGDEQHCQQTGIELIASENLISEQVTTDSYNPEVRTASLPLPTDFSLSDYEDDEEESGFCCPCCLPR